MSIQAETPTVFIDADVLVAGSLSATGASHLILRLAELGVIVAVSSEQVRREATRNLLAKLPAGVATFRLVADAAVRWAPDPEREAVRRFAREADAKDVPILAAAVGSGCVTLITFNVRDYRPSSKLIRVETPGDFILRLRAVLSKLAE